MQWFLIIIVIIIIFIYNIITETKVMSYVANEKTLYLHKHSILAKKSIIIKRFYRSYAEYKPAEIVHSGMMVGGAFLGSSHINEAHYELSSYKTDKYLLYYENDKQPIERIVCDFEISKNSTISKYHINKHTILVKNPDAKELDKNYLIAVTGNTQLLTHAIEGQREQECLTKEECKKIKSWVIGEIE